MDRRRGSRSKRSRKSEALRHVRSARGLLFRGRFRWQLRFGTGRSYESASPLPKYGRRNTGVPQVRLDAKLMKLLSAVLAVFVSIPAWSQQLCAPDHVDVTENHASATADHAANLRMSPGSLRAQFSRLAKKAEDQAAKADPASGNPCSSTCAVVQEPAHILMSLVPNKFLSGYADEQKCEELLRETSVRPLRFGPRRARSEKELGTWLSDVSQGRGDDGTVLYRKCSGKCSPRYLLDIARDGDGLVANLDVVCGPARDKTDNTYAVASGYRWACRAAH